MEPKSETYDIFQANFEQLDTAFDDPFVKRLIAPASVWNQILAEEAVEDADAARIVNELDTDWIKGGLMKEEVEVTGQLYREDESHFAAGEVMLSNGFVIMRDASGHQKVMHQFAEAVIDEDGDSAYKLWASGIEGTHLEFTKMSDERARAWLEAFYPDLIAQIDELLFNYEGDEAESIIALQELSFDEATYGEDLERVEQCVALYLESVLGFDKTVPYAIELSGKAGIYDVQKEKYIVDRVSTSGRSVLFIMKTVCIASMADEGVEMTRDELCLGGTLVLDTGHANAGMTVIIPLDSLCGMKSVRDEYYRQAD